MGKSKFSYKKVIVIKLNRFEVVSGKYIEEISGQSRIGYSMSDTTDFYDMIEWSKKGGYQGSIISFYDYNNGKIYEPFQKQRNVLYGPPVYLKNSFWLIPKKRGSVLPHYSHRLPSRQTQCQSSYRISSRSFSISSR